MSNSGSSFDVLRSLRDFFDEIDSFYFKVFKENPVLQDRLTLTSELDSVVSDALTLRNRYQFPFWDAMNVSLFNRTFPDYDFLREIGFHNHPQECFKVSRDQVDNFWENWDKDKYLTINSLVLLSKNANAHIPLFDFHVPVSQDNENLCVAIISHLGLSGWLLDSGKSYHFIGDKLLSTEMLCETLAKALLFSPVIDRAWIAHQILEKSCCLRISNKYGRQPLVVRQIGNH
jgi:hypothetical protein